LKSHNAHWVCHSTRLCVESARTSKNRAVAPVVLRYGQVPSRRSPVPYKRAGSDNDATCGDDTAHTEGKCERRCRGDRTARREQDWLVRKHSRPACQAQRPGASRLSRCWHKSRPGG